MGAEERRVDKEPVARDTAEKALVHRGHKRQTDEKFGIARREVGEQRLFERRIEPPLGGKEGAECLHRRKEPIYPVELFGRDAVEGAHLLDAHRELGDGGQEREQPLGVGRRQGDALFPAPKRMETEKSLILRHGNAAGRLGDAACPVVVKGKYGREETAHVDMDEVVQEIAAATSHRDDRESAHVGIMDAEPLDESIYRGMEVIGQSVGLGDLIGHSDRLLPGL